MQVLVPVSGSSSVSFSEPDLMTAESHKPNQGLANETISRPIFQYIIASGEMRYIERTERSVVMVINQDGQWFLRGEVEGCGTDCHINLAQILLEYSMSCEGCEDQEELDRAFALFSDRVSKEVVEHIKRSQETEDLTSLVEHTLAGFLRSMDVLYSLTIAGRKGELTFQSCPICQNAESSGYRRGLDSAHTLLIHLFHRSLEPFHFRAIVDDRDPWNRSEHQLSFRILGE